MTRTAQVGVPRRNCETCGKDFQPYRSWMTTCSRSCRAQLVDKQPVPFAKEKSAACQKCRKQFSYIANGGNFRWCELCRVIGKREQQQRKNYQRRVTTNPARRLKNRTDSLRRLYKLTVPEYEAMLKNQKDRCAICGDKPNPNGVRAASRLHVDHDHLSGKTRALLCSRCNTAVGLMLDDPDRLRAAAEYIERHRT